MAIPAIFLDRDGVLNENRPDHVKNWGEFTFIPGVLQAVRELTRLNHPIFVVTNQAVINRRQVSRECIRDIHRRMLVRLWLAGGMVDGVFCCPHAPAEGCRCRKPAPGLLLNAAARFDLDLSRSVFVGDAHTDILAGQQAHCKTILVLTGRGRQALRSLAASTARPPTAVAADLAGAVPIISRLLQAQQVCDTPAARSRLPRNFGFPHEGYRRLRSETWATLQTPA